MLSLLFLPIKLAVLLMVGLLLLPFVLLRIAFKAAVALLLLPFVLLIVPFVLLIVMGGVLLAVLAASASFLLPFAIIGFCVWLLMRPRAHHAALG
jgi:hypothetical protein